MQLFYAHHSHLQPGLLVSVEEEVEELNTVVCLIAGKATQARGWAKFEETWLICL